MQAIINDSVTTYKTTQHQNTEDHNQKEYKYQQRNILQYASLREDTIILLKMEDDKHKQEYQLYYTIYVFCCWQHHDASKDCLFMIKTLTSSRAIKEFEQYYQYYNMIYCSNMEETQIQ
jgi:hypothetical protein